MDIETTNIFLDTSIFENENFLKGHKILQLGELSRSGVINAKITNITYNEIKNRIRKNIELTSEIFTRFNTELNSKGKVLKNLEEYKAFYPLSRIDVMASCLKLITMIDEFIRANKIEIVDSSIASIPEVFYQYFSRKAPFGDGKKKDEFPDAFTLSTAKEWCIKNGTTAYILSTDKDLTSYSDDQSQLIPICDIAEFLAAISKFQTEASRISFVEQILNENIEISVARAYDKLGFKVFERLYDDPNIEELTYEPPEIEIVDVKKHLITDINDSDAFIDVECEIEFKMTIEYRDLESGWYDREDGKWHSVSYVNEENSYRSKVKMQVKVNYSIEDGFGEIVSVEIIELIDLKEVD